MYVRKAEVGGGKQSFFMAGEKSLGGINKRQVIGKQVKDGILCPFQYLLSGQGVEEHMMHALQVVEVVELVFFLSMTRTGGFFVSMR